MTVSIVTLLWRNERYAPAFMASLEAAARLDGRSIELIAVENGPDGRAAADALLAAVADADHIELAIHRASENLGFAGGANRGCAAATGDVLVVANLDLEFDPEFIVRLGDVEGLLATPAFVAPMVTSPIGHSGGDVIDANPLRRDRFHRHLALGEPVHPGDRVPAANGSCLIFGRSLYDRRGAAVGGVFDEEYHSYYEDVDLFWWADRQAIPTWWVPSIRVHHHQGGSFGGKFRFEDRTPRLRASVMANYRLTVWRHAKRPMDVATWLLGEVGYLVKCLKCSGPAGAATYARSWPLSIRRLRTMRSRRGSWR